MNYLNDLQPQYDLTYSDVFLVPQKSEVGSRLDVDLSTFDGTGNTIPLVASNMSAVTGKRMAETVARRGGLAVLPQDILPEVLSEIIQSIKRAPLDYDTPITLLPSSTIQDAMNLIYKRAHNAVIVVDNHQKPVGIFTPKDAINRDMFTPLSEVMSEVVCMESGLSPEKAYRFLQAKHLRVAPVVKGGKIVGMMTKKGAFRSEIYKPNVDKNGRLKVAVAIGINGDVAAKALTALKFGADILVIDTAHGHQQKMIDAIRAVRQVASKTVIVAGNVVTAAATRDLIEAGANIIKVGIGPGAMCTTRMMTGVGRPQFSAIVECAAEAKKLGGFVWADGGIRYPRDVALALAAGASNVMLGSWFAGTYESVSDLRNDEAGKPYKENYGMASHRAVKSRNSSVKGFELARKELFAEGISTSRMYLDNKMPGVEDIIDYIISGVRSTCTYVGAASIDQLNSNATVGIQSASGYNEGTPLANGW
ncbi:MAG: GuaB1 family IMP dehydrogenase-related protein [Candidatus Saccharimonadales bacterium]